MARIGFRSTTVADEPTVRALLQEAHGAAPGHPMFASRHLYWKYWQPREGWQGSRSYVLTSDEQIVAHAAVVPSLCNWGTERLLVLHVIDWAARAEARGAGATLMQHIGTLGDAIFTADGGDAAWQLLPFPGFPESNTVVTQFARPLRPLLYLTGAKTPSSAPLSDGGLSGVAAADGSVFAELSAERMFTAHSRHSFGPRVAMINGTMPPLLNIAVRAARRAGEVIVRSMNRLESITIASKGRNDFVTEVDRAAEQEIIGSIRRHYPQHAFLAEESGRSGEHDTLWIIDPLDGTTNFLHGFPVFAVSIACQVRGRLEHAVVYDPLRQELFTASRGAGAHLDNRRMRVSKGRTLEGALVATGFPYRANMRYLDCYLEMLRAVTLHAAGVRRPGAAALDLAYVAAGRVDAFWEIGLSPWDTAAGTLLIQEAGGRIGTLSGAEYRQGGHIVAGTPKVYAALIELLAPHVPAELRAS